ncbi:DNA-processing protein DprA [Terrihabitans sp. B22-R8]|uniref:DNA-processing protein DprA n=1 Tax=Terrihabitans sp. B22-R8 TaxID=3425128 RepID=UPI00403C4DCC
MALSDTRKLAWLRLIRSENIGTQTFRRLLHRYGSAEAALEALPDLARRGGARVSPRICSNAEAERELAALERLGARLIGLGDPDYPSLLAHADGAPPLLTSMGDGAVLNRPIIAIVGGRNASAAGRTFAARLAAELGDAGFAIASGLARGIDASAHEASLGTGTIAVMAGGPDRIYPPEHKDLLARLQEKGTALTEMPAGWTPRAQDFPRRNRIIAGLAIGTVVVEAALRSGSLITARLANEMGREVLAAPGSPLDPRCEGSNKLLRDGATLITKAEHVVEAISPSMSPGLFMAGTPEISEVEPPIPLAADDEHDLRSRIESLLGPSPCGIDDLVRLAGAPAGHVQFILLELEIAGRLERHFGGRVSLV